MNSPAQHALPIKVASPWRNSLALLLVSLVALFANLGLEQHRHLQHNLNGQVESLPIADIALLAPQHWVLPGFIAADNCSTDGEKKNSYWGAPLSLLDLAYRVQTPASANYLSPHYLSPRTGNYSPRSPPHV